MQANSTAHHRDSEPTAEIELLVDLAARRDINAEPPRLSYGIVAELDPLTVSLALGRRPARRAKSCLAAPERGDRVLCAVDGQQIYLLAVLSGAETSTRIATEGDLALSAGGEISLSSASLRLSAQSALAALGELRLFGRSIEAELADRASLVCERIESRASRLVQRCKQAFRFVEELEQLRAGVFDVRAESLAAVRGENTIMSARVLAKLDGEQVKIG